MVTVAVATLIILAFIIPLGFLVQRTAEDRAVDAARADAASVVPALVGSSDPALVQSVVAATAAGREGRLMVALPDRSIIGEPVESDRLEVALATGASAVGPVPGGAEVVVAVATGPDRLAAVRVFVPDAALTEGRSTAWGALGAVGVMLVVISVAVADRLSRSIVRPVEDLAAAAERLGAGELTTAVEPDGPDEIQQLGATFNHLGSQVAAMLQRERELVAELSHRLRTPLTHLTLRAASVDDPELRAAFEADIAGVGAAVDSLIQEARGMTGAAQGCDAAAVLRQRAAFWEVLADDQGREWSVAITPAAAPVGVGESELVAAIDVLIENVFRHTPDDAAIEIGCRADDRTVEVWVGDGGPGLDPNQLGRGRSGGGSTGLGLDIVRQLATRGGGEMSVGSSPLGGAAITVRLPARRPDRRP